MLLNFDLNLHLASFLSKPDLGALGTVSTEFHAICRDDRIWKPILAEEYEMHERKESPPGVFDDLSGFTWWQVYVRWRITFDGYHWKLISLTRKWWLHMEKYLLENNLIDIFNTLNPPASEAYIDQIEHDLQNSVIDQVEHFGKPTIIPQNLRILYRFHDGQHIPLNESLLKKQCYLGLFGGTAFYDNLHVNCLLPLKHFVRARDITFQGRGSRHMVMSVNRETNEMEHNYDKYERARAELEQTDEELLLKPSFGPAWLSKQDCCVFSINTSDFMGNTGHKVYLVDCSDHLTDDETADVFTNMASNGSNSTFIPCVDYTTLGKHHSTDGNVAGITGSLFDWLFEYLRRLENGIVRVDFDHRCFNETPSKMISHFMVPFASMNLTELEKKKMAYSGAYQLPSSVLTFNGENHEKPHNQLMGRTFVGLDGVEITICPCWLPALSNPLDQESIWTYSVRMRLLSKLPESNDDKYYNCDAVKNNPDEWMWSEETNTLQYHGNLRSCRLTRRKWMIHSFGQAPSVAEGSGVIGIHPELIRGRDEELLDETPSIDYYFGYQSLNRIERAYVSDFEGIMYFQNTSRSSQSSTGNQEEIGSPTPSIQFCIPTFIY
eukprot:GSChrysophyteH1.ASY1.ANO1.806.1 assembled CDS